MTANVASWELERKCKDLTPVQADDILFPGKDGVRGSRGAPSKANRLCYGCPVKRQCLIFAIENDLEGNWAATSKKERKEFAKILHIFVRPIEETLPPEPQRVDASGKRIAKYLIVKKVVEVHDSWMDSAVSPLD